MAGVQLIELDRQLCRRWLQRFSATAQTLQDSCGDTSESSTASKPAGR